MIKKALQNNYFIGGFFLLLTLLLYAPVLLGDFLFDDNLLVENNVLIRSLKNLGQFFVVDTQAGSGVAGSNFYRPLQSVVYALLYAVFELNPFVYHLVPVLLHALNAFLFYLFLQKLKFSQVASLLAAVIFTVHPVNAEAISYISGVVDPLALCFMLGGILEFWSNKSRWWLVSLCFVLALLSKESAIVLAPLLFFLAFWRGSIAQKKKQKILLIIAIITIVYLWLKFSVFDFTGVNGLTTENNLYTENLSVRLITFLSVLWDYFLLIIFPKDLYLERPYLAYKTLLSGRAIFGMGLLFFATYYAFVKRNFALGFAWFLITIIPFVGIVPLNAIFLEHWLYVPLLGVLIIVASIYDNLQWRPQKIIFLICFLLLTSFFSGRLFVRNIDWADPVLFYENEIRYSPDSARVRSNLAMELSDRGQYEKAIEHYQEAIALRDIYPQSHHNLAHLYFQTERYVESEEEYFLALKIDPNFAYSYHGLLQLYQKNEPAKAEALIYYLNHVEQFSVEGFRAFLDYTQSNSETDKPEANPTPEFQ